MGNTVVCESPAPFFAEVNQRLKRITTASEEGGTSTPQQSAAVYVWMFRPLLKEELFVEPAPVLLADLAEFDPRCTYVVLHVYSTETALSSPTRTKSDTCSVTVTALLQSARGSFSPRGLSSAEEGNSVNFSCEKRSSSDMFDLYLWRGKDSTAITSSVALASLYSLARKLKQRGQAGLPLLSIVEQGNVIPLRSVVFDDVVDTPSSHTHSIWLAQNHLFSRVVAVSRKNVLLNEMLPTDAVRALRRENTLSHLEALMDLPKHSKRRGSAMPSQVPKKTTKRKSKRPSFVPRLGATPQTARAAEKKKKGSEGKKTGEGGSGGTSKVLRLNLPEREGAEDVPNPRKLKLDISAVPKKGEAGSKKRKVPPIRSTSMPLPKKDGITHFKIPPIGKPGDGQDQEVVQESKEAKFARFDKLCSRITDRIFLSSVTIAKDDAALQENKITHVLNCAGVVCPEFFPNRYGYKTLQLLDGGEDIRSIFYEILDYFNDLFAQPDTKILVHCYQGVSRSSSMVILYLMWRDGTDYDTTFRRVKEARGVCKPNTSFMCQLLQWYNDLHMAFRPRLYRITPLNERCPKYWTMRRATKEREDPTYEHLDPRFCHVLNAQEAVYIWKGEGTTMEQLDFARLCVERLRRYENAAAETVELAQGEETDAFWDVLGGKGELAPRASNDKEYDIMKLPAGPFLFPYPNFERLVDFNKKVLRSSDAFILQDDMRLFAWVGKRFSFKREHQAEDGADIGAVLGKLFFTHVNERVPPRDSPVVVCHQGKEDPSFWEAFVGRDV